MNYLGIDIGGSKTLIAVFDEHGEIIDQLKFPTDPNYEDFLKDLEKNVERLSTNTNTACCVAVPGLIDREAGKVHALGNLGWRDKSIRDDVSKVLGNISVIIENDTRVAGLAEANMLKNYNNVFYLTISTGIGGALIEDGHIVKALQDMEVGQMPLLYEEKVQIWESFASGKAIVARYGKQASEIEDDEVWHDIGQRIAYGVAICTSSFQPDVLVFGGGVGQFADKFKNSVNEYFDNNLSPLVKRPAELLTAHYKDNSAIYGCFELLKQRGLVK